MARPQKRNMGRQAFQLRGGQRAGMVVTDPAGQPYGVPTADVAELVGAAPDGAAYIVALANAALAAARVLTDTASVTWDFTTPGQAKATATAGGAAKIGEPFTGDGVTTAFVLAHAPTAGTVAVYLDGVRQTPTTAFTVAGSTVTFTPTAPALGAEILIDYLY